MSIRVGNDIQKRVEQYQEEKDISEADAYRQLIERGLDASDCEEQIREINEKLQDIETQAERDGILDRIF
ncbi:hypothetical protein ACOJIV_22785 [Haloarcula sp. AONF1]